MWDPTPAWGPLQTTWQRSCPLTHPQVSKVAIFGRSKADLQMSNCIKFPSQWHSLLLLNSCPATRRVIAADTSYGAVIKSMKFIGDFSPGYLGLTFRPLCQSKAAISSVLKAHLIPRFDQARASCDCTKKKCLTEQLPIILQHLQCASHMLYELRRLLNVNGLQVLTEAI